MCFDSYKWKVEFLDLMREIEENKNVKRLENR